MGAIHECYRNYAAACRREAIHQNKIGVLMGEYSSLRAEIHHRITLLLTLAGTGITVAIAVTGAIVAHPQWVGLYALLLVAIVLYVVFAILMDFNIYHLTKRVRELEAQVNLLAGERLLKWEDGSRSRQPTEELLETLSLALSLIDAGQPATLRQGPPLH